MEVGSESETGARRLAHNNGLGLFVGAGQLRRFVQDEVDQTGFHVDVHAVKKESLSR